MIIKIEDIKKQIKEFTDIAVIGLSGGADSTLVAILCTVSR
jgi:PP-loop superfamily ATP-utilizing enzyme